MDDLRESLVRHRHPVAEAATHVVASSVPGLRFETTKEESGYTVRAIHAKSSKLLWTTNVDRIPKEKLDTSLKALDRVWRDSGINWDVEAEELTGQKNLGSVVSGITKSIDQRKKPITHNDPNEPILGKLVYYESKEPQMDKRSVLERLDETRIGKPRIAKGLQQVLLKEDTSYEPGCGSCGKQSGLKNGQCKDCRDVSSLDKKENEVMGYDSPTDLKAEGVCLEAETGELKKGDKVRLDPDWAYRNIGGTVELHGVVEEPPKSNFASSGLRVKWDWSRVPSSQADRLKAGTLGDPWVGRNAVIKEAYTKPKKPASPGSDCCDGLDKADAVDDAPENPDAEGQKADPAYKKSVNEGYDLSKKKGFPSKAAAEAYVKQLRKGYWPWEEEIFQSGGKWYIMAHSDDGPLGIEESWTQEGVNEAVLRDATRDEFLTMAKRKDVELKSAGTSEHIPVNVQLLKRGSGEIVGGKKKMSTGREVFKVSANANESGLPPSEYYAQKGKTHPAEKNKNESTAAADLNSGTAWKKFIEGFNNAVYIKPLSRVSREYMGVHVVGASSFAMKGIKDAVAPGVKTFGPFLSVKKYGVPVYLIATSANGTQVTKAAKDYNDEKWSFDDAKMERTTSAQNAYLYESMGNQRVDEAAIRAGARRDRILANATDITVYDESTYFSGGSVGAADQDRLRAKMKERADRGAKLTKESNGRYHLSVHANLWYDFKSSD